MGRLNVCNVHRHDKLIDHGLNCQNRFPLLFVVGVNARLDKDATDVEALVNPIDEFQGSILLAKQAACGEEQRHRRLLPAQAGFKLFQAGTVLLEAADGHVVENKVARHINSLR
jgi:hypothetical protein